MSSLIRLFTLAALAVLTACERQTYTCCIDGYVETCTCPRRDLCMVPNIRANADGTCDEGQPIDSGDSGDSGTSR
jgi:hypothetical protein